MELGQDRRLDRDDLLLIGLARSAVLEPLPTERWHIASSEVIDWREWGDEFVVRVASRAETHLLSAAAGSILLVLLDGRPALTLDDMYSTAVDDADTGTGSEDSSMSAAERESLQAILADFERLRIVTRTAA